MKEFFLSILGIRTAPAVKNDSLLPQAEEMKRQCTHRHAQREFKITVLGVPCEFEKSAVCPECLAAYMNCFSTLCGYCEEPILPGMSVANAYIGAPHAYAHMQARCASATSWRGTWGEGRLIEVGETHNTVTSNGTIAILQKTA